MLGGHRTRTRMLSGYTTRRILRWAYYHKDAEWACYHKDAEWAYYQRAKDDQVGILPEEFWTLALIGFQL